MADDFKPSDLARRDAERTRGYRSLLDFYHSIQWEGREKLGEKRLTFNYARVIIDKVTSYLMSGVGFSVEPIEATADDEETARRARAALRRVHEENSVAQLDFETEIDCAILGDACYKVTWDESARDVRITAPDVQGIYTWRFGDDSSKIWKVASRYTLTAEEVEMLYRSKPAGKEAIVTELWTDGDFELWLDEGLIERKPNPYGFIPFVIYPNIREPKKPWGVSDLTAVIEPQRELNRAMSQLSKILELSGNPIAVLENVEQSEDIAVRPGAVWNIPEDAKAYLLDLLQGGGLKLHIDYINLLYRTMHDVAESPRAAFGGTDRDLSGVALEIELQPLLQKVRRKRIIRAAAYNRRSWMILRLLEKYRSQDFSGSRPEVIWGPLLPRDADKLVVNEQILVQGGIHSRRRAMDELGVVDPEAEFARWLEERAAILRMNREFNSRPSKGSERERERESLSHRRGLVRNNRQEVRALLEDEVREDNGAQPAEGVADYGGEPGGGEKPNGDGLPEDEVRSPDEAATADQQVSIAGLEAAVAAREGEITTLKESVAGLEERLATAVGSLAEAVARYRAAIVRANPEVVEDLITGDTIDGIDESLVTARNVIDRVKQGLEEETALARVPAGAPERRTPDLSALSSREKIRYAIGGKR